MVPLNLGHGTFYDAKDLYEIPMGLPQTKMPNACGVNLSKIAFFHRSRSCRLRRLTAENLCPSATAVRVHDVALAEEYAVVGGEIVFYYTLPS